MRVVIPYECRAVLPALYVSHDPSNDFAHAEWCAVALYRVNHAVAPQRDPPKDLDRKFGIMRRNP
jgi:hypothetical protein